MLLLEDTRHKRYIYVRLRRKDGSNTGSRFSRGTDLVPRAVDNLGLVMSNFEMYGIHLSPLGCSSSSENLCPLKHTIHCRTSADALLRNYHRLRTRPSIKSFKLRIYPWVAGRPKIRVYEQYNAGSEHGHRQYDTMFTTMKRHYTQHTLRKSLCLLLSRRLNSERYPPQRGTNLDTCA
jgi:hypothetical protein